MRLFLSIVQKVVNTWVGYGSVFILFLIGNDLISDANFDLLGIENERYGLKETFHLLKDKFCRREETCDESTQESIINVDNQQKELAVHLLDAQSTGQSKGNQSQDPRELWRDCFQRIPALDTNSDVDTEYTSEI